MNLNIEYEQEENGRWLAEVIGLPGVLVYGDTPDQAMVKAEALALRVLAENWSRKKANPCPLIFFLRYRMTRWSSTKASQVLAALTGIWHRLANQAPVRFTSYPLTIRMA